MLQYLTRQELDTLGETIGPGHWDQELMDGRWDYHDRVIAIIRSLSISDPQRILEMGTMGASLVKGSDSLDFDKWWDFPGKRPTYNHDARQLPWPVESGKYELFVALRVFQHLAPVQEQCFLEAKRIARRILLVVPREYRNEVHPHSRGITYGDLLKWNGGAAPTSYLEALYGDLYFWDSDALEAGGPLPQSKMPVRPSWVNAAVRKGMRAGGQVVNGLLRFSSLELRRRPTKEISRSVACASPEESTRYPERKEEGIIVEFVGAPGIGKSVLCHECLRTKRDDDNWLDGARVLETQSGASGQAALESCPVDGEELLRRKLENSVGSQHRPSALLEAFNHYGRVVAGDSALRRVYNGKCAFIDEGICHNFSNELAALEKESPAAFERLLSGRFVVFCEAPAVKVVERIRRRAKVGHCMPLHKGKNDDELLRMTQDIQISHDRLKQIVETRGLPYAVVDCSNPVHVSMKHVQDSLRAYWQSLLRNSRDNKQSMGTS
jgi:hypothetical protein